MNAHNRKARWLALTAGLAFLGAGILNTEASPPISKTEKSSAETRAVEAYGKLPLTFEANQGQTDPKVKFLARGDSYGLFLTPTEAMLSLGRSETAQTLHLRWMGANPAPRISGQGEQRGRVNYLKGDDPKGWRRNVPSYARVAYEKVYPGIDLVFYGNQRQLEHDYVLAPGADPRKIRFTFEGANHLEVAPSGELVVHFGRDEVRLHRPIAYQEIRGVRSPVPVDYRLISEDRKGLPEVAFTLGIYDPGTALVIDPVLVYSSYLGGYGADASYGIAVDSAGNAYVTGETLALDFPDTATLGAPSGWFDAFVTKFDPEGRLVYSTVFGGSGGEAGWGIAADAKGNVYVSSSTDSPDFPRVGGLPVPAAGPRNFQVFVVKLDPSGSSFLYSTLLGGSSWDSADDLAIDSRGHAYVTGATASPDFPVVRALSASLSGPTDAFVAKLAPDASSLVYSTFLGGGGYEQPWGIAVDANGEAHVVGSTSSQDFPVIHALYDSPVGPFFSLFVAKLSSSGSSLVYSTYYPGEVADIAADRAGNAYVAGWTSSPHFPVVNAVQPTFGGESDAFVTKLSPRGRIVYSTYLGGTGPDAAIAIDVGPAGSAYVTGRTDSTDFPLKDPLQSECTPTYFEGYCFSDVFVTRLSPKGSEITFSTYLGGSEPLPGAFPADGGAAIAVSPAGDVYISGSTYSADYPTLNAFQPSNHGGEEGNEIDAFVTRISLHRSPKAPPPPR